MAHAAVVDFLTFEGGHPRVLRGSGGLDGGLAVQLLSAVARVSLRLCQAVRPESGHARPNDIPPFRYGSGPPATLVRVAAGRSVLYAHPD